MNVYRHPSEAPANAPNGTPTTWATVIPATTVPSARPRYSVGASELATADAAGTQATEPKAGKNQGYKHMTLPGPTPQQQFPPTNKHNPHQTHHRQGKRTA